MLPHEDQVRQEIVECRNPLKADFSHLRRSEGTSSGQILRVSSSFSWIGDAINAATSVVLLVAATFGLQKVREQQPDIYTGTAPSSVPTQVLGVGPVKTRQAERASIGKSGRRDNPFGMWLTAHMVSKRISDAPLLMSLLSDDRATPGFHSTIGRARISHIGKGFKRPLQMARHVLPGAFNFTSSLQSFLRPGTNR